MTSPSKESLAETKPVREIFNVANISQPDVFDQLLKKWRLWKTLRICAWISRFIRNVDKRNDSRKGPLSTAEIQERETWWINRVQARNQDSLKFEEERARLNLRPTGGILKCHGRIQGDLPIYLPDNDLYTEKLVELSHNETLHGGVSLTMSKVREISWIPRLRRLAKRLLKRCFGCRRFQAIPFPNPQPGKLPKDQTEGDLPSHRSRLRWSNQIPDTRKEGIQSLHNRICMLADPRVVSRVNKDVEYGRVPNNVQKIHCKKRKAQESLLRQR